MPTTLGKEDFTVHSFQWILILLEVADGLIMEATDCGILSNCLLMVGLVQSYAFWSSEAPMSVTMVWIFHGLATGIITHRLFFLFFFWPHCMACGISVPQPETGAWTWARTMKPGILTTRQPGYSQDWVEFRIWRHMSLFFLALELSWKADTRKCPTFYSLWWGLPKSLS